jgi:Fe-S-cluster containining protein
VSLKTVSAPIKFELESLPSLPPSETCFDCSGCCIFTEADSPWIPYFRSEEIQQAVAAGIAKESFPDLSGSRIRSIPYADLARCPALNPDTHECTLYEVRPLDCRLYPFLLMWNDAKEIIYLTLHEACPFTFSQTGELPEALSFRANILATQMQTPEMIQSIMSHPGLVMNRLPDTHLMIPLYRLTCALLQKKTDLTLFLPQDVAVFREYQSSRSTLSDLSHSAFLPHLIWSDLLDYRWTRFAGMFCLFATSHGMTHLALPPFGGATPAREGSVLEATALAFARLSCLNPPHIPSRMDNVDEETALLLQREGYVIEMASPEYLYKRKEIVELSGNKFRAERALVNQANRFSPKMRPFTQADTTACLALYDLWAKKKDQGDFDAMMREDAKFAHHAVMSRWMAHGVIGRVVEQDGVIVGYTFGFTLSSDTFCVLLEISDRSMRGLSAWLFQAFCQEMCDYTFINTMDDSGLDALAFAKRQWHPVRMIPSYRVTQNNCSA